MDQLSILEPPIARNSDPSTSFASERRKNQGSRQRDKDLLLELIKRHSGHTAMEYGQLLIDSGVHWLRAYGIASKRISDLHAGNHIRPIGERVCGVSGHRARVWVAATDHEGDTEQ